MKLSYLPLPLIYLSFLVLFLFTLGASPNFTGQSIYIALSRLVMYYPLILFSVQRLGLKESWREAFTSNYMYLWSMGLSMLFLFLEGFPHILVLIFVYSIADLIFTRYRMWASHFLYGIIIISALYVVVNTFPIDNLFRWTLIPLIGMGACWFTSIQGHRVSIVFSILFSLLFFILKDQYLFAGGAVLIWVLHVFMYRFFNKNWMPQLITMLLFTVLAILYLLYGIHLIQVIGM